MPLDTSIPLQVQIPQIQDYSQLAAQTQANALRAQMMQQEMAKNALSMQNAMEDRRRAEANRAAAAAKAAEDKRIRGIGVAFGDLDKAKTYYTGIGRYDLAKEIDDLKKSGADTSKAAAEADKIAFSNSFTELSALAPYVANGAIPATNVVDAIVKHPVLGKHFAGVMSREEMYDFAAKNPQGVAQILATPPDKIYDSFGAAASQAKPTVVSPGSTVTDLNPQSPTYRQVIAQGAPTAQQEKAATQTKQLKNSIGAAIASLDEMSKEGGLLDKATASGAGAAVDYGASVLGIATPGSIATGELQVLQDPILKMIPRFEGPQSDKDTLTYQQAAGQLANPNVPAAVRKAAAKTLIKLFKERQDQFGMADLPEAGVGTNAPAASPFQGYKVEKIGD